MKKKLLIALTGLAFVTVLGSAIVTLGQRDSWASQAAPEPPVTIWAPFEQMEEGASDPARARATMVPTVPTVPTAPPDAASPQPDQNSIQTELLAATETSAGRGHRLIQGTQQLSPVDITWQSKQSCWTDADAATCSGDNGRLTGQDQFEMPELGLRCSPAQKPMPEHGAAGKAELKYPNLGSFLDGLTTEVERGETSAEDAASQAPLHQGGSIAITIHLWGNVPQVSTFLEENGGSPRNTGQDHIEAYMPVALLGELSEQPGVLRVRAIVPPNPQGD